MLHIRKHKVIWRESPWHTRTPLCNLSQILFDTAQQRSDALWAQWLATHMNGEFLGHFILSRFCIPQHDQPWVRTLHFTPPEHSSKLFSSVCWSHGHCFNLALFTVQSVYSVNNHVKFDMNTFFATIYLANTWIISAILTIIRRSCSFRWKKAW